jgi:hypothetical protein
MTRREYERWRAEAREHGLCEYEVDYSQPARLLPHLTTRNVRQVTPGASTTLARSSSIGPGPRWSNNRTPSPSRTGTRSTCISSRSPALMHCWAMLAEPTATSLSPATALACSTALSTPSVTNVNEDPS